MLLLLLLFVVDVVDVVDVVGTVSGLHGRAVRRGPERVRAEPVPQRRHVRQHRRQLPVPVPAQHHRPLLHRARHSQRPHHLVRTPRHHPRRGPSLLPSFFPHFSRFFSIFLDFSRFFSISSILLDSFYSPSIFLFRSIFTIFIDFSRFFFNFLYFIAAFFRFFSIFRHF